MKSLWVISVIEYTPSYQSGQAVDIPIKSIPLLPFQTVPSELRYEKICLRYVHAVRVGVAANKPLPLSSNAYQNYQDRGFAILRVSDLQEHKGTVYLKYGITSIPANFLIDPNGVVIAKDLKGEFLNRELEKLFLTPQQ